MLAFTGRSIDETSDILSSDLYFRRLARQRRTTMTQITQIITAARTDETVIRTTRVASENSKHFIYYIGFQRYFIVYRFIYSLIMCSSTQNDAQSVA